MARRTTVEDIQEWLVGLGADAEEASAITDSLSSADLSPAQMRRWLKPDQNYSIFDCWVTEGVEWNLAAIFLIEDGKTHKVIAAAADFAAASPDERFISTSLGGANLDQEVRKLTRNDPDHAAQVRRVIEILLAQLKTPMRVRDCLQTTFGPGDTPPELTRVVDCLLDDRFDALLASLEVESFDAWDHLEKGVLHGYGW